MIGQSEHLTKIAKEQWTSEVEIDAKEEES